MAPVGPALSSMLSIEDTERAEGVKGCTLGGVCVVAGPLPGVLSS